MIGKLSISCVNDVTNDESNNPKKVIRLPIITKYRADKSLRRNPVQRIVKFERKRNNPITADDDSLSPSKKGSNSSSNAGISETLKTYTGNVLMNPVLIVNALCIFHVLLFLILTSTNDTPNMHHQPRHTSCS